ncbi:hypothetical protein PIB30_006080 [Stylosanthes scabra]|uniref:GRF-type domain-containing protein n=1 Tax=Stylosanthes scabra TaxID=79078 RepID=A0ABU6V4X9_9FABA|nr:hypothetical protein [Stylosanthes scabra]
MASSSSRYSRPHSTSQTSGGGVVCHHGVRPVLRVARTKENHGRRFWGCAHYAEPCEFFVWADSGLEQEEENEKVKLRRKVAKLKIRVKRAERMKNVAVLFALVGWVGVMLLWVQNYGRWRPAYVMP